MNSPSPHPQIPFSNGIASRKEFLHGIAESAILVILARILIHSELLIIDGEDFMGLRPNTLISLEIF